MTYLNRVIAGKNRWQMKFKEYENTQALEAELKHEIVEHINAAIEVFGDARILLSGGSTPLKLYALLAEEDLVWSKVKIGLVDDRFVPVDSEFNNGENISKRFEGTPAEAAEFAGMTYDSDDEVKNRELVNERYEEFFERIDFALLGMGTDGHTASLFPGDSKSEALLNSKSIGIYSTTAPDHPTKRLTCSKEMLMNSRNIALYIKGEKKKEVLNKGGFPISTFVDNFEGLNVYYC